MRTSYLLHYTELALDQRATGRVLGDFELDSPTWLDVEFDINPGQELILRADPNDCQEGFPTTVNVNKVTVCKSPMKLTADDGLTLTLPSGFDITEYLSKSTIEQIEEEILAEYGHDDGPDYDESDLAEAA